MPPCKRYNEHLRDIGVGVPMRSMCRLKQSCHGFSLATPLLSGGRSFPDDLSSSSAHTFSQSEQSQHSDDLNVGAPNSRVAGDVDSSSDDSITFGVFVDTSSRSNISSASLSDNENDESTDVPASKAAPARCNKGFYGSQGGYQLGLGAAVVLQLCSSLPKRDDNLVVTDDFFTGPQLVEELSRMGIFYIGTVRENRLSCSKLMEKKLMKKQGRGTCDTSVTLCDQKTMAAAKWHDNRTVTLLSNCIGADSLTSVKRWDSKEKKHIFFDCPAIIPSYNRSMGGVDLLDKMGFYYRFSNRSKRWWCTEETFLPNTPKPTFSKYHVIRSQNEKKTVRAILPFLISKTLTEAIGPDYKCAKDRNWEATESLLKVIEAPLPAVSSFPTKTTRFFNNLPKVQESRSCYSIAAGNYVVLPAIIGTNYKTSS
ncbi:hypothetical protein HPB51_006180 [Rhipicephalus microplus]|uniref:PiggyBac transposable element-derived protein domain-containing protein n=1 Tax=Rhipicephalus microplus TaxID=6941 RepID=A0A9J6E6N6_RHIMP|nr:hypothetical protein HPB51_006180 [Rhipicephalus microplus]